MFLSPKQGQIVITQKFGERPLYYKKYSLKGHNGIDLCAPVGTPLFAPIDGIITFSDEGRSGYGKYARIKNEHYECVVAHLSQIINGTKEIRFGSPIGLSGNTGDSTGPHIHLGIRKLNPDGSIMDLGNGFKGYVDILPYILVGWRNI